MVKLVCNGNCRCAVVPITDVMDYEPFNPEDFTSSDGLSNLMVGDIEAKPRETELTKPIEEINNIDELINSLNFERINSDTFKDIKNNTEIILDKKLKFKEQKDILIGYNNMPKILKLNPEKIEFSNKKGNSMDELGVYKTKGNNIEIHFDKVRSAKTKDSSFIERVIAHELGHALDASLSLMGNATAADRIMTSWWASELKGGEYKSAVSKDRRSRKKNDAEYFVSDYARLSSGKLGLIEDFAEAVSMRAFKYSKNKDKAFLKDSRGNLISYKEFELKYPNRCKIVDNYLYGDT